MRTAKDGDSETDPLTVAKGYSMFTGTDVGRATKIALVSRLWNFGETSW